jgi:hypothetical protein
MGILWGRWKIPERPGFYVGFYDPLRGGRYAEVALRHEMDGIKGHTDGLVSLGGKKYGVEIKSINDNGFKWLDDKPIKAHEEQALIYMHCLEEERRLELLNDSAPDSFAEEEMEGFIFLYENKNTQELKEFLLPYDSKKVRDLMDSKKKLMYEAREFQRSGNHPECRCVPGKESPLCKEL